MIKKDAFIKVFTENIWHCVLFDGLDRRAFTILIGLALNALVALFDSIYNNQI